MSFTPAILYELYLPHFTQCGTLATATERLPDLVNLGINTIWLMPIHPVGTTRRKGTLGSPYAVRDYTAIRNAYGSERDLRQFVAKAHALNLRVLLDWVPNHTAWDHRWTHEHPDWYTRAPETGDLRVPISPDGHQTDWTDTAELNYQILDLHEGMIDAMAYWVQMFDIDGFRCDMASWVPDRFWRRCIPRLREIKPLLFVAESDAREIHDLGFDIAYSWEPFHTLKRVWQGEPMANYVGSVRSELEQLPKTGRKLRFTTNHDETAWDGPPPKLFNGHAGALAAATITFTLPGAPLLYNGQETGAPDNVSFFEPNQYAWDANPDTRQGLSDRLHWITSEPALQQGAAEFPLPDHDDIFLMLRRLADQTILVAVNARNRPSSCPLPERLIGRTATTKSPDRTITLPATLTLSPYETLLAAIEPEQTP